MFKFLKKKIKDAISSFSKKVDEEAETEELKEVEEKEEQQAESIETKEEIQEDVEEENKVLDKEIKGPLKIEEETKIKEEKIETEEEPKKETELKVEEKTKSKTKSEEEIHKDKPKKTSEFKPVDIKKEKDKKREEKKEDKKEKKEKEEKKKGLFKRLKESISTKKLSEEKFDEIFWDFELALLENNVAVEVIEKIKEDLKANLINKPIQRNKIEDTIVKTLKGSLESLFKESDFDLFKEIDNKKDKPYVIAFIGVNGSGKTTTIAKFAYILKNKGYSVVLSASDTFRAAAIDQLEYHANKLGIKIIKHDYGHDGAAVAYDAIKHAQAKHKDVVLIDTAGRLHSNKNLLEELKKLIRVAKPDLKLFVGESITGNDCIEQAKTFNEAVGIDGIVLSKIDVDDKGGSALSISYITNKPILFLGNGQNYEDLIKFNKDVILNNLGLEE